MTVATGGYLAVRRQPSVQYSIRVPDDLDVRMFQVKGRDSGPQYILRALRAQVELDEAREREAAAHEAKQQEGGGK